MSFLDRLSDCVASMSALQIVGAAAAVRPVLPTTAVLGKRRGPADSTCLVTHGDGIDKHHDTACKAPLLAYGYAVTASASLFMLVQCLARPLPPNSHNFARQKNVIVLQSCDITTIAGQQQQPRFHEASPVVKVVQVLSALKDTDSRTRTLALVSPVRHLHPAVHESHMRTRAGYDNRVLACLAAGNTAHAAVVECAP